MLTSKTYSVWLSDSFVWQRSWLPTNRIGVLPLREKSTDFQSSDSGTGATVTLAIGDGREEQPLVRQVVMSTMLTLLDVRTARYALLPWLHIATPAVKVLLKPLVTATGLAGLVTSMILTLRGGRLPALRTMKWRWPNCMP